MNFNKIKTDKLIQKEMAPQTAEDIFNYEERVSNARHESPLFSFGETVLLNKYQIKDIMAHWGGYLASKALDLTDDILAIKYDDCLENDLNRDVKSIFFCDENGDQLDSFEDCKQNIKDRSAKKFPNDPKQASEYADKWIAEKSQDISTYIIQQKPLLRHYYDHRVNMCRLSLVGYADIMRQFMGTLETYNLGLYVCGKTYKMDPPEKAITPMMCFDAFIELAGGFKQMYYEHNRIVMNYMTPQEVMEYTENNIEDYHFTYENFKSIIDTMWSIVVKAIDVNYAGICMKRTPELASLVTPQVIDIITAYECITTFDFLKIYGYDYEAEDTFMPKAQAEHEYAKYQKTIADGHDLMQGFVRRVLPDAKLDPVAVEEGF